MFTCKWLHSLLVPESDVHSQVQESDVLGGFCELLVRLLRLLRLLLFELDFGLLTCSVSSVGSFSMNLHIAASFATRHPPFLW